MRRILFVTMSASLFLTSCSSPERLPYPLSDLPLPPAAYGVKFQPGDGSQPNELSFKVDLHYPSKSVLEHYGNHLETPAWTKCQGPSDDWGDIIDGTKKPAQRVHTAAHYWLGKDEETIVGVALQYYSPMEHRYDWPANNVQHVSVHFGVTSDAASWLRLARVYCGAGEV